MDFKTEIRTKIQCNTKIDYRAQFYAQAHDSDMNIEKGPTLGVTYTHRLICNVWTKTKCLHRGKIKT